MFEKGGAKLLKPDRRRTSKHKLGISAVELDGSPILLFLAGLAVLPPIGEPHKQLILITIAAVQLLEIGLLAGCRRGATSMPCC